MFFAILFLFHTQIFAQKLADMSSPSILLDNGDKLFFNTRLVDGAAAYPIGNDVWLLLSENGVIKYNSNSGEIEFRRLYNTPVTNKWEYFRVYSWAKINDEKYMVGTVNNGGYVFEQKTMEYVPQLGGRGLIFEQDPNNSDIWATTAYELRKYSESKWTDLTPEVNNTGIGRILTRQILPDGELIWFNGDSAAGGLLMYDTRTGKWKLFHKELLGTSDDTARIHIVGFIASPRYVWAIFDYQLMGSNIYLAVYDKKAAKWKSYPKASIKPAIDLLVKELPHCRWNMWARPIIKNFSNTLEFTKQEIENLRPSIDALDAAFSRLDPQSDVSRGLYPYSVQHGWIVKGEAYGPNTPLHKIGFPQFSYSELLVSIKNTILLETSSGLGVLDLRNSQITNFTPTTPLSDAQNMGLIWIKPQKQLLLCEAGWGFSSLDGIRISKMDLENMTLRRSTETINTIDCSLPANLLPGHRGPAVKKLELESGVIVQLEKDGLIVKK